MEKGSYTNRITRLFGGVEPTETTATENVPTETAPTETAPTETAPTETAPTETAPTETAPTETAPVNASVVTALGPKKKLTKAEKKARLLEKKEKKRIIELEANRQQIRDHLLRELKYGHITYTRAFESWQSMCRGIKLKELEEELAALWQKLNYIFDQKKFKMELLYDELEEAEQMHQRSFSKHKDILDYMIKIYEYIIKLMKDNYEREAEKMILEFYVEMDDIDVIQDARKTFIENFVHLTNIAVRHNVNQMKFNFEVEERDAIDANIEHQYFLKDETVKKMGEMHNQILQIVNNLQQDSMDSKRQLRYNAFAEKNQTADIEFIKMGEATKKGWDVIVELQKTLAKTENMYNIKLSGLRNEKTFYVEHYWRLREGYKMLMAQAAQEVSLLAHESYKAIQELAKQKRYGELLVGLVQCCRKLQSEREKVLPWPGEAEVCSVVKGLEDADDETTRLLVLQLFWYRVSRAQSHVLCLKKEKEDLQRENAKYCQELKSCYEVETNEQIIKSLTLDPPVACITIDRCPKCNLELPK